MSDGLKDSIGDTTTHIRVRSEFISDYDFRFLIAPIQSLQGERFQTRAPRARTQTRRGGNPPKNTGCRKTESQTLLHSSRTLAAAIFQDVDIVPTTTLLTPSE